MAKRSFPKKLLIFTDNDTKLDVSIYIATRRFLAVKKKTNRHNKQFDENEARRFGKALVEETGDSVMAHSANFQMLELIEAALRIVGPADEAHEAEIIMNLLMSHPDSELELIFSEDKYPEHIQNLELNPDWLNPKPLL